MYAIIFMSTASICARINEWNQPPNGDTSHFGGDIQQFESQMDQIILITPQLYYLFHRKVAAETI